MPKGERNSFGWEISWRLILSITFIQYVIWVTNPNKGDIMAKGQDAKKTVKKAPTKTLKEKRSDKKTKKSND